MQKVLTAVFSLLFLQFCLSSTAQRTVSGEVRERNTQAPLAKVTVSVVGSNVATSTDSSGNYSLSVPAGKQSLRFSSVGFETQTIALNDDQSTLNVLLQNNFESLDQVVVVGYGTQKRANLTGAVSSVNVSEQIGSRPVSDLGRGLQGAVPGLTITTPTGEIGTNPNIKLRGITGSLNGGANPLILVDNVEFPDLRLLNPQDIESISVLKDAASTSIYGARAAWGVILITTKKGRVGGDKTNISYSNNFSFSKPTVTPKIADAAAGAEMAFRALQRTNPNTSQFGVVGMYFDQIGIEKIREWEQKYGGQDLGPEMVMGRDFEIRDGKLFFYRPWDVNKLFLRKTTPMQTHNISITGSGAKTGYTLNLGYLNQGGVLKVNPDKFERFNVDLGLTSNITDWFMARAKVMLSKSIKTRPFYYSSDTYDPWYYLYRWPKIYPYGTYEGHPFRSALTEVQQATMTPYKDNLARVSLGGTLKIIPGLTVDADYTFTGRNGNDHFTGGFVEAIDFWAGAGALTYKPYTSASYNRAAYQSRWNDRNNFKLQALYQKSVAQDHDFKLMAGMDVELYQYWTQYSMRKDLIDPNFGEPKLATGDQEATNTRGQWATNGYFGRLNYAFKNKLLLEVNGRFDGSSSFPQNDKWAFFPSVSAGYVVTREPFMNSVSSVLNFLKLRGSYGSLGNQPMDIFDNPVALYISRMAASESNWLVNGVNRITVATPRLVSPSLTWETVTTLDFGLDARFFENQFGISFDWYKRTTSDMITGGVTVPASLGTLPPQINYGEMETTGWELELDYNKTFQNGLSIGIKGVLSDFTEKITKFSNTTRLLSDYYSGKRLGDIWGYQTDRLFQMSDFEVDANGNLVMGSDNKPIKKGNIADQSIWESGWFYYGPGDIKYKDLDGNDSITFGKNTVDDHGDLTVIGNTTPRYQYGFRLTAAYKGFDLNMFIQGVGKRDMYPNTPIVVAGYRPGEAWYQHQLDYWTPQNPNAFYPRPTDQGQSNNTRNFLPQTRYLLNMAYTRLKNLTVGYTLPAEWTNQVKIDQVRIYFSGENLWETSKLNVPLDPEIDYTRAGLNDPNTFGRAYPYTRNYSFGLQITF